jgi:hypothetical protein
MNKAKCVSCRCWSCKHEYEKVVVPHDQSWWHERLIVRCPSCGQEGVLDLTNVTADELHDCKDGEI